jgi:hypothetical protein
MIDSIQQVKQCSSVVSLSYRVSIKSFPDYKHLLEENYVEYKYIFLPLLKLVSKSLCYVFIVLKKICLKFVGPCIIVQFK